MSRSAAALQHMHHIRPKGLSCQSLPERRQTRADRPRTNAAIQCPRQGFEPPQGVYLHRLESRQTIPSRICWLPSASLRMAETSISGAPVGRLARTRIGLFRPSGCAQAVCSAVFQVRRVWSASSAARSQAGRVQGVASLFPNNSSSTGHCSPLALRLESLCLLQLLVEKQFLLLFRYVFSCSGTRYPLCARWCRSQLLVPLRAGSLRASWLRQ